MTMMMTIMMMLLLAEQPLRFHSLWQKSNAIYRND